MSFKVLPKSLSKPEMVRERVTAMEKQMLVMKERKALRIYQNKYDHLLIKMLTIFSLKCPFPMLGHECIYLST